jgi:hypothetical protein
MAGSPYITYHANTFATYKRKPHLSGKHIRKTNLFLMPHPFNPEGIQNLSKHSSNTNTAQAYPDDSYTSLNAKEKGVESFDSTPL